MVEFEKRFRHLWEAAVNDHDTEAMAFIIRNAENLPNDVRQQIGEMLINPPKVGHRRKVSKVETDTISAMWQEFKAGYEGKVGDAQAEFAEKKGLSIDKLKRIIYRRD